MSKRKRKVKREKEKNNKAQVKGYSSVKILFFLFLGLVFIRFILFIVGKGEFHTDDLWLRLLMITLGTFMAWWLFRKREK